VLDVVQLMFFGARSIAQIALPLRRIEVPVLVVTGSAQTTPNMPAGNRGKPPGCGRRIALFAFVRWHRQLVRCRD
jgi:hypothetical protein